MKRLTFELEFITPAFIGGANQQAELRPTSFVGLLRWWWRALKGECDIERLREEEIKIFGGDGKMASPVYLRVEGDVSKDKGLIKKYGLDLIFDEKKRAFFGSHIGVGYLYYFMILPKKKRNGQEEERREFIEPGSRLKLTLIGKDEFLKHYIASLWALVFLGGVGARSRRGGGNLAVIDYNPKDLPKDLEIFFTPTGDLYKWLVENLKKAKELVGSPKTPCDKYGECECEYSTLPDPASSDFKLEVSKKTFNTWFEALNDIGKEFMRFRSENKQSVFDTAVFGLPVMHSNGKFVEAERGIRRRSSPVIIKVVKTPEDKYKWMVLRLRGKFLPDGAKLRFWEETGEPNLGLIEEFFKALAELLFGEEDAMIRLDMSEFKEEHSVAKLIGAPPGYVGYEEGGKLTEAVRRKPYSVILLDEVEKAHPRVFDLFLQVLDDGRLTDSHGRTVDFRNTVIIMTSNIGSQYLLSIPFDGDEKAIEREFERAKEKVLEELKYHFRPEFLNRIDEIIVFKPLTVKELLQIVDLLVQSVNKRLADKNIHLELTEQAKEQLVKLGYEPAYGARPLKRTIQRYLENPLADKIIRGEIKEGDRVRVDYSDGNFVFVKV